MTEVTTAGDPSLAAMLEELPADLAGHHLLEVVPSGAEGQAASALADRGAEEIVRTDRPLDLLDGGVGGFGFALCRNVLRSSPYPMALLADLWRLVEPGGILLLDSEIVPGPEHSQYARFAPAPATGGGWVPGRLVLRWMVEASGFDVERWLDQPQTPAAPEACLRAIRASREPARSAPG